MDYIHISQINFKENVNNRVYGRFLVKNSDVRLQKDGENKYVSFVMSDKDFSIECKRFNATEKDIELLQNGNTICGGIDIKPYAKSNTGYSCILYNLDLCDEPASNFVLWANGMAEAKSVIEETLRKLANYILGRLAYNLVISNWEKMSSWTAASSVHHDVLGGLMVHTAEVIKQSEILADYWNSIYGGNFININLLITGALLHDIGKLTELNVDTLSGCTEYSDEATLSSHITTGVGLIELEAYRLGIGVETEGKSAEQLAYEKEQLLLLKHEILSHHGKKEWGSPVTPATPEAIILNRADELSSEMFRCNRAFKDIDEAANANKRTDSKWIAGTLISTYKDRTK